MLNQVKMPNLKYPLMQKISTFFAYYLAVASIFPLLRALPGYQALIFLAMFAWLICAMLAHPSFFIKPRMHTFVILLFISYTVIAPYLFGNPTIGNRYLDNATILIFYLIYQYNNTNGFNNSSKAIVMWSLPFVTYTSIVTLMGLINNPYLSRSIKTSGEHTMMLRAQGIGGYELIYFLVFISIILFFILSNGKLFNLNFRNKILVVMLLILFVLTIIYANYFTALIMLLLSCGTIVITKKRRVLIKTLFAMIGFVILVFSKSIFFVISNWLIGFLKQGSTVEKLISLQSDIMGSGESIFMDRTLTIESSWNAFLKNPIGGIVINPIESRSGFLVGFGQHSQFMDTLALYGIIIGMLNIYIILQPYFVRMKRDHVLFGLNSSMLISTFLLFSTNNATTSIGFVIFFIYPVVYNWARTIINTKLSM